MAGKRVQHVVLLQPTPETDESALQALAEVLADLQNQIGGIERIAAGPNTSPEDQAQRFDWGFIVTFRDAAARDAYLPHPAHLAVVPLVLAVAERTTVYDIEVP
jgi:hypothetical protein